MPKRACPFENIHTLPQRKWHIGNKEVEQGDSDKMQEIYEKTQKRLFDGCRKLYTPSACNGENSNAAGTATSSHCSSCQALSRCLSDCSFCEKAACSFCLRICYVCGGPFCPLCSILRYHRRAPTAYCLSCLK